MAIPVLIPAHNEALQLPRLFEALEDLTEDVDPIVIDNASTDNTADIARNLGATILSQPERGQLRSIQLGLREVGLQDLVLILDADTEPCPTWASTLRINTEKDSDPTLIFGPVDFNYPNRLQALRYIRQTYKGARAMHRQLLGKTPIVFGQNMGLVNVTLDILSGIDELPNYGLGNDQAIAGEFLRGGGNVRQIWDKKAQVMTDGDRYPDLSSFIRYLFNRESAYIQDGSAFSDFLVYPIDANDKLLKK